MQTVVGKASRTLKGSTTLCKSLTALASSKAYATGRYLFKADDDNCGIFLIRKGKVTLRVEGAPNLERVFSTGSVLGLPSTFADKPYSLTAKVLADAEVVNVPQKDFLEFMRRNPALCREANEMLSRELSFIHAALAQRKKARILQEKRLSAVRY